MIKQDWKEIKHFDESEISRANSEPIEVDFHSMKCLDNLANYFKMKYGKNVYFRILWNGITGGIHASIEHSKGKAFDIVVDNRTGENISTKEIIQAAYHFGFRGVGCYWNGSVYSFHFDTGERFRSWMWKKRWFRDKWVKINYFYIQGPGLLR